MTQYLILFSISLSIQEKPSIFFSIWSFSKFSIRKTQFQFLAQERVGNPESYSETSPVTDNYRPLESRICITIKSKLKMSKKFSLLNVNVTTLRFPEKQALHFRGCLRFGENTGQHFLNKNHFIKTINNCCSGYNGTADLALMF